MRAENDANVASRKPLVSVVMAFRNARDTLGWALQSLQWQTYQHWELILLEDGATDGSAEVALTYEDPRIRLFRDRNCRGLPVRLNQGIELAQGELIARMDADDVAYPERFAKQVEYLERHPEIDLLASSVLMLDQHNQALGVLEVPANHAQICRRPWHGFSMPHPTWMGRVRWFRRHAYDERARKAQDQLLLYRSYRHSRFAGLPDILLGYRYAELSLRKTLEGRYRYVGAVLRQGHVPHALAGLCLHGAAGLRDVAGMALHAGRQVIQSRAQRANATQLAQWEQLRQQLRPTSTIE